MVGHLSNKLNLVASVNETVLGGLLHASITTTNCFSADTFSVTLALDSLIPSDMAFWSTTSSARVEIKLADGSDPTGESLITGLTDTVHIDPICRTVTAEGRDLSSSLIDCYRQQEFVNQTASEIVAQIALSHNLIPVITATTEAVGRYYGDGYTRLSLGQFSRLRSDWDVVVELARENSFDVFIQGDLLFFQPAALENLNLVGLRLGSVQRMRIERSLVVNPNTTARVQSWDSRNMASYDSTNISTDFSSTGPSVSGDQQTFLFSASNMTSAQVTNSAERLANELGRLATVLEFDMPFDLRLIPRSRIIFDEPPILQGMMFQVDSVERRYSSKTGSVQSVRALSV